MRHIWVDGIHLDWDNATTHLWSEMAIRGVSAFEGIICPWLDGRHHALALHEHFRRLQRSCSLISLTNPLTEAALAGLLRQAARQFPAESFYARPTVFARSGSDTNTSIIGHFMGAFTAESTSEVHVHAAQIAGQPRIGGVVPPDAKTGGSYLDFRVLSADLQAETHLFVDRDGFFTEADGAGLMLITDDGVLAPPTSGRALDSITRRLLLRLADDAGIRVHRGPVHRSAAHGALVLTAGTLSGIRIATLADNLVPIDSSHLDTARQLSALYYDTFIRHSDSKQHTPLSGDLS